MLRKIVFFSIIVSLVAVFPLAGCAKTEAPGAGTTPTPAPEKVIEWPMQEVYAETAMQTQVLREWADKIAQRTNGGLKITIYPSGGLDVPWSEALGAIQDGSISIIHIPTAYMGGSSKFFGLTYLPVLITSVAEHQLASSAIYDLRVQEFAKFNAIQVSHWPWGNQIYASKKPLRTVEDFKGLKVRSTTPEDAALMEALDANPITMPYTDVYTALQRGTMDAFCTGVDAMAGVSAWEVCPYINNLTAMMAGGVILVNKDAYMNLPPDIKNVFLEETYDMETRIPYLVKTNCETSMQELIGHGMTEIEPSPELMTHIYEIAPSIWENWAKEGGPLCEEGLKLVREALDK
jgi:TRAP-type C4-dicarboxylate transport system substrate-binding protein